MPQQHILNSEVFLKPTHNVMGADRTQRGKMSHVKSQHYTKGTAELLSQVALPTGKEPLGRRLDGPHNQQ